MKEKSQVLYIGVDLGTSSIKTLLMDEQGNVLKIAIAEYPVYYPQIGWAEQNPADWYAAFIRAVQELLVDQDNSAVAGISFSGQMHGMVILDEHDEVIRPAILWNDSRALAECDYLNETIGQDKISAYTGNMALVGFTAPKILWLKKHEPENYAKIKKLMLPKDYLLYRLTGEFVSDVSDAAGTLLFDVKNKQWSREMLEIVGLDDTQVPHVYESYEVVGTVESAASAVTGLSTEVRVVAGGGDQAVASVGTGTVEHGMCNVSLGTSGVVFVPIDEYEDIADNVLHVFNHANGKYFFMGVTLAAAASNEWWMKSILQTKEYDSEQADYGKLGENDVYFLPYLSGERTPYNNSDARGTFIGMTVGTSRLDMTAAVLEGVAFSLRDILEIIRAKGVAVDTIRINGGGAKSDLWCQIIANVFDVEVVRTNSTEGPAFGAAILAAVACGAFASVEEATSKLIRVTETISQDADIVEKYDKRYEIYHSLYPTLEETFTKLSKR